MATTSCTGAPCFFFQNPVRTLPLSSLKVSPTICKLKFNPFSTAKATSNSSSSRFRSCFTCKSLSPTPSARTMDYEFADGSSDVELRLNLGNQEIQSTKDIFVQANDKSLTIRVQHSGSIFTLLETNQLFEKIKSTETIWYIDDDQLVVSLKKHDPDLQWPDIIESWESLTAGSAQLLKGASIYIVGDSTEINQKVAQELAVGLGYTPLCSKELLETFSNQTIDAWVLAEGSDSVAKAEKAVFESLSSHIRAVIATVGGQEGAARRGDGWRHLYAGFSVWLSMTEAADEQSAKEEARINIQYGQLAYSKADVVVKFQGWDTAHAKTVAQACLSALKQLIISDKGLPEKKSLYIRLGCRGDWPNIKPPGWSPSADANGDAS